MTQSYPKQGVRAEPTVDSKGNGHQVPRRTRERIAKGVILFGLFATWAFLALPGKHYVYYAPGVDVSFYQHGWPAVHYERTDSRILNAVRTTPAEATEYSEDVIRSRKEFTVDQEGRRSVEFLDLTSPPAVFSRTDSQSFWIDEEFEEGPYWLKGKNWSVFGDHVRVRWKGLVINLLVLCSVFVGSAWLLNHRIRKRGLGVSLRDLAVVMAIFGLVCMYYSSVGIFEKNRLALERLESVKLYDLADRYDIYPEPLIRLAGRRVLPRASHFRSMVIDFSTVSAAERDVLEEEFRSLRYLLIAKFTLLDESMGWCLKHLAKVEELSLVGPTLKSNQWNAIGKMRALVTLRVSGQPNGPEVGLPGQFFRALPENEALEELELHNCQYTSDQLRSLSHCNRLRRLTLQECPVDDEVLGSIEAIPNLSYFNAKYSGLSDAQMNRLEQFCPKLLIVR